MPEIAALPADLAEGSFALRAMMPEGPAVFALLHGAAFDMTPAFGTCSAWLNEFADIEVTEGEFRIPRYRLEAPRNGDAVALKLPPR